MRRSDGTSGKVRDQFAGREAGLTMRDVDVDGAGEGAGESGSGGAKTKGMSLSLSLIPGKSGFRRVIGVFVV
jgi:hypothetical protein